MKRVVLSAFVIVSFLLYSVGIRNIERAPAADDTQAGQAGAGAGPASADSGAADSSAAAPDTGTAAYKDGAYTGPVTDAFYGPLQVQAIIKGGKLADVKFLKYPDDQPNSIAINEQAMPYLKREAIRAQSAQVDGVSGATDTAKAFVESLSEALRQAM